MGGAMPIVVLVFGAFIAWLMLSKEGEKQVFLFYLWAAAIAWIVLYAAYHYLLK